MSLLNEINKKRKNLSHTTTTVMCEDGRVFLQEFKDGNEIITQKMSRAQGYVVDRKPDLQVAKILPGLFLGSQDPALDEDLLLSNGITHVLSIGVEIKHSNTTPIFYNYVEAFDLPEFNITSIFERCFDFINSVLEAEGSVYVHCNAGVSRSPSIIIGYLINEHSLTYEQAYRKIKEIRPSISPNPGFVKQLKSYEIWLNKL